MTPDEVHEIAFRQPRIGRRGYDQESVDVVLSRIEDTLRGQQRITREELSAMRWQRPPIGRRGYREEDVETFIRRVIAEWPAAP